MKNYTFRLGSGIKPSPEFAKKGLAQYAVNVGLRCGHDCTYCSSRAMLRCHKAFGEIGEKAFDTGYSIVDPEIAQKVAADAKRLKNRGLVQICTTVDAWAPEAYELRLGRKCLEAILVEPGWTVRILTKNAAVAEDFDLIAQHKERVLVGLSLTGTSDKKSVLAAIEPHASPISERLATLAFAHRIGLRTYGMLCPLLPGIADGAEQIDQLVGLAHDFGAEEVFSEAINARGNSLTLTEKVLRATGFESEAKAISQIRKRAAWSAYVVALLHNLQTAMRKHMTENKLRFLLYPSGLAGRDCQEIKNHDAGVIWL